MEPKTTKTYMAEYTVKSVVIDGGCLMPDPEPYQEKHHFEAADDAEAKKKAEGYKSEIRKNYFGLSITLESVSEVRPVELQEPKPTPLEVRVRKVSFDKQLESLVDNQTGQEYTGRRFETIYAWSNLGGFSSRKSASADALEKLEDLAQKAGAEAYEITSEQMFDTEQEYDSAPYTCTATAILYRRG